MKRLLAFALILALMLTALVGCSTTADVVSEEPATEESAAPQTPEVETPAATEDESAPEAEPVEDVIEEPIEPEETVPTLEQVEYDTPLFEETAEISIWYPLRQDNVQAPEKNSGAHVFWAEIQELLNVHITFTEPGQSVATEKYNLMCASGEMPDLMVETLCTSGSGGAYTGGYDKAIEDEVYLDISGLIEENCPNYWYWLNLTEANKRVAFTDTGKMGAFLTINGEQGLASQGIACNADMLAATGLDKPETPSDWKEMYAVLKDNGVYAPCDINSSLSILEGGYAASLGAIVDPAFCLDAETGEFVFGPTTDQTRQYIRDLADFYAAGYIDPDFVSQTNVMDKTNFHSGKTFTSRVRQNEMLTYAAQYGVNIEALPTVRAENGTESGNYLIGTPEMELVSNAGVAVSVNAADNLDAVLLFMDWFYSPLGSIMSNYGIEGITFDYVDGEPFINDFYEEKTNGVFNRGIYTVSGDIGLVWPNCTVTNASDIQQAAMDGWTEHKWDGYLYTSLPGSLTLTASESESISNKWTDIDTVIESTFLSWVVGDSELTDESWDQLCATVEGLGLADCQEVYEAAYARYLAK